MKFGCLYLLDAATSTLPSMNEYGYFNGTNYRLFNSGNVDIPFEIVIPLSFVMVGEKNLGMLIQISRSNSPKKRIQLKIDAAKKYSDIDTPDEYIKIDSKNYMILGCDSDGTPTGTIYNDCIIGGTFFNL